MPSATEARPASRRVRRLAIVCALLLAPTLLLAPALLPGRALLPADLLVHFQPWEAHVTAPPQASFDALVWDGIAQYYPWRHFAAESLRAGRLPLWNPYQFCGTPFFANGQSAVLYPLNVLFWMLPVAVAFGWSAWLHLVLTGWFSYLFLRRAAGIGRPGAIAGAVVWQTNSFLVAWIHLPTVLCTLTWLPLVLLFCEQAMAGEAVVSRDFSPETRPLKADVIVALSPGASPHGLGTEVPRHQAGVAAGAALGLSYLGGHPQMFLFTALLTAAYLVARAFSRALVAPLRVRITRLVTTGVTVGSVGLGLAAAQLLPTLDFLGLAHRAFTPGPASYAFYLKRALQPIQLVGLLLPHPLGNPANGTYIGPENYAEYTLYIGLLAFALALLALIFSRTWHTRFFAATGVVALLAALGTTINWPLYHWVPGIANTGSPARMIVLYVFAFSLLAGVGADLVSRKLHRVRALPVVLTVVLGADLLLAAQGHIHAVPRAWVYAKSAKPAPTEGRLLANSQYWGPGEFPNALFPPNAATVYHLRDVSGYDSLYFAHYRDFAALLQGGEPSPPFNGNMLLPRMTRVDSGTMKMMRLAGVSEVLSAVPMTGLMLAREGNWYTYRVPDPLPRAWVTPDAVFAPDSRQSVAVLSGTADVGKTIVVAGPPEPVASGAIQPAAVHDLSPDAVRVDLPRGGGGWLFLADSYAPGWRAFVDGKLAPISVADVTFRAVRTERDTKRVEFRYEPAPFRVGLFVSLLTLAAVAGAFAAGGRGRRG